MALKNQLALQYNPKGFDLNRSARSDLVVSKNGRAYQQTKTFNSGGERVKVVLHFCGSHDEVHSCTIWKVTPLKRLLSDIERGEFHYQLEQRRRWTANADTIALDENGKPIFFKRCQQREKVGTTSVRPAVPVLSNKI